MKFATTDSFRRYLDSEAVEFVDFIFSDALGVVHHMTYDAEQCRNEVIQEGITFDGSSVPLYADISSSDMILKPDLTAESYIDPFTDNAKTLVVRCNVYDMTGSPSSRCPRNIALLATNALVSSGIADTAYFGPEPEFFVFDNVQYHIEGDKVGFAFNTDCGIWNSNRCLDNLGHRVGPKQGYLKMAPVDRHKDLRCDIIRKLKAVNITPEKHHCEAAAGQQEIGIKYDSLIPIGDSMLTLKHIVKNCANQRGQTATFMPKPLTIDNGTGCHIHQSLWKAGVNLFYDSKGTHNLSQIALWYMGGILQHAGAIMAFTNPSTNSYKRLRPGFEAPTELYYSSADRTAAIRIPYCAGDRSRSTRIETRFPDGVCNPYLGLSAMLLAGIDGIKRKIDPTQTDLSMRRKRVPESLEDALKALDCDKDFLKPAFNVDFLDVYMKQKWNEARCVSAITHPKELELYYHV